MTTQAQAQTPEREKSFLVADCGHTNTTVALFDTVAGSYRLIARATVPTTDKAPWVDISQGVQQAIARITDITGRKLLNKQGRLMRPTRADGSGVDEFAAVLSAAPPLTVLLGGLFEDVSLKSARKALHTTYVAEVETLSLADTRTEGEQVTAVIEADPDVIFIVGGTDGGAEDRLMQLVETINLGVNVLADTQHAQVVFAGNINLRSQVRELIGDKANVQVVDNVRPNLEVEQIDDAIRIAGELYEDIKIGALPGIKELREWSNYPLRPTARAFGNICQYFAALNEQRVLGLDLGSDSVSLVMSQPEQTQISVRTEMGIGRPVRHLLDCVDPAAIARWAPAEISMEQTADFVFNRSLHPFTTAMTETGQYLEQALAREVIRSAVQATAVDLGWSKPGEPSTLPPFDLLLARGGLLANTARPGQVMLLLLDALQPTGIFSIALDQYGVLPALGALATHQPLTVVQALEAGVLTDLGWVIAPAGNSQPGKKVLKIIIESEQAGFEGDIEYGKIEIFPIPPKQPARVTIKPARRFDVGFGPGQGKTITLYGGTVGGLVVDARGRPLTLPQDDADRRSLVRKWLWDMGG